MIRKRKHRKPQNLTRSGPDAAVIALMTKYKSDPSKIRPIHFYLYFLTATDALQAKSDLCTKGFTVDIDKSSSDSQWLCLAAKEMNPDELELSKLRRYLTKLAESLNGNYDGWETEMIF